MALGEPRSRVNCRGSGLYISPQRWYIGHLATFGQQQGSEYVQGEIFNVFAPSIDYYPLGNHWFQNKEIHETYLIIDPKPKADLP